MPLSKRLRFEVLTRDRYRCRYCGATALEARLHVDHAHPASRGGKDTMDNLVTACSDCNLGKATMDPHPIVFFVPCMLCHGLFPRPDDYEDEWGHMCEPCWAHEKLKVDFEMYQLGYMTGDDVVYDADGKRNLRV